MPIPILLVTGFLGAGKTTLINHLLTEPGGRRLAAVVNDFGAIDIDAALLAGASDGVVSLKNGCICCSLQGDLLRTLATLLRRVPAPEGIVVETSGVSDPAEIVRTLLDPVIWRETPLDAVLCVADARHLTDRPALLDDALCLSQLRAADYVVLNKTGLVTPGELAAVRGALGTIKAGRLLHDSADGRVAPELLFSAAELHGPAPPPPRRLGPAAPAFQTVSWTADRALSLPAFQALVGRLAGRLVRAKGFVRFAGQPDRTMVFQLVGERATISPAPPGLAAAAAVQLVFIAVPDALDEPALLAGLEGCLSP